MDPNTDLEEHGELLVLARAYSEHVQSVRLVTTEDCACVLERFSLLAFKLQQNTNVYVRPAEYNYTLCIYCFVCNCEGHTKIKTLQLLNYTACTWICYTVFTFLWWSSHSLTVYLHGEGTCTRIIGDKSQPIFWFKYNMKDSTLFHTTHLFQCRLQPVWMPHKAQSFFCLIRTCWPWHISLVRRPHVLLHSTDVTVTHAPCYGLFPMPHSDSDSVSDSDSKPYGYVVLCRTCFNSLGFRFLSLTGTVPILGADLSVLRTGLCLYYIHFNQGIRVWIRTLVKILHSTVICVWVRVGQCK